MQYRIVSPGSARAAITTLLLLFGTAVTYADTPAQGHREVSKETREKLALLHEQFAACLRTEKSLSDCHSEMVTSCRAQLGSECTLIASAGHGDDNRHRMHPMGADGPR